MNVQAFELAVDRDWITIAHGRGLRGRLVPPGVPLYRTRSQQFDDMVLDAVARLEGRWEAELTGVVFAVQEVPEADELTDEASEEPVALLREALRQRNLDQRRFVPAEPGDVIEISPV